MAPPLHETVQQRENEDQDEQLSSGGDSDSDSLSEEFLASPRLSDYRVKTISPPKPVLKKLPSGSSAKSQVDNESKAESKKKKRNKVSTVSVAEEDGTNKNGSGEGNEDEARKASGKGKKEEVKKSCGPFNRVWREEDEIDLLKAIQDYKSKYGSLPNALVDACYDFTRKLVHVEFTKTQLYDKIRRLKRKYETLAEKSRSADKGSSIKLNPHENKLLHLANKIWGKNETNEANDDTLPVVRLPANNSHISKKKSGGKVENAKVDAKSKKQLEPATAEENTKEHAVLKENGFTRCHNNVVTEKNSPEEFWARYPYLNKSLEVMKQSSNELTAFVRSFWLGKRTEYEYGNYKAKEIDEKWKKLEMEEMELNIKKVGLIQEHAKVALDAMKKH